MVGCVRALQARGEHGANAWRASVAHTSTSAAAATAAALRAAFAAAFAAAFVSAAAAAVASLVAPAVSSAAVCSRTAASCSRAAASCIFTSFCALIWLVRSVDCKGTCHAPCSAVILLVISSFVICTCTGRRRMQ